jgi:hypothetical protein
MGLFDIFRRTKQREALHPVFGRIVYQGDAVWELGKAVLPPVGHEVEVIIHAEIDGPGEAHMDFWRDLIERWPKLKMQCEPLFRRTLVDWIEAPERGDIWSRVTVESLPIYSEVPPDQWELVFWCEEAGHWPTVSMRTWTPTDCFVDG